MRNALKMRGLLACVLMLTSSRHALADAHPTGAPALSSRPGAAYTVYLDFAGFNFTGNWGATSTNPTASGPPGSTPAYNLSGSDATTFSATELANIPKIWARVAEKYAPFNINVTTVDPALAAGKADTDAHRQAYYDGVAKLMHTVIGGSGAWNGGGGVSYTSVTSGSVLNASVNSGASGGKHTNWVFSAQSPTDLQFIAEGSAHENGHGLGLAHQSDFTGTTLVNTYSTNNDATGNGTYAPIMGDSYDVQRGAWRIGTKSGPATQNDVKVIAANTGLNFVDDGIGHTTATATALSLTGSTVNSANAKGVIMPKSETTPVAIGTANYTSDYFTFFTLGGTVKLTATDGGERLATGVADPGATLNSNLQILDAAGNVIGTAAKSASTMSETFTGTLAAGKYFALVTSNGGYTSTFDASAMYFDQGSYFLSGTGLSALPEPACAGVLALMGLLLARRRRGR